MLGLGPEERLLVARGRSAKQGPSPICPRSGAAIEDYHRRPVAKAAALKFNPGTDLEQGSGQLRYFVALLFRRG